MDLSRCVMPPFRGAILNPASPLSRGLKLAMLFNEYSGGPFEHVRHIAGALTSGASWSNEGVLCNAAYECVTVEGASKVIGSKGSFVFIFTITEDSSSGRFMLTLGSASATFSVYGDATDGWGFRINDNDVHAGDFTSYYDGKAHVLVALWDDAADIRQIYIDGKSELDNSTAFTWPSITTQEIRLGGLYYSSDFSMHGIINGAYFYDRILTDGEVLAISCDPFIPFRPPLSVMRLLHIASGTIYYQSVYGNMPSSAGTVVKKTSVKRTGNMPASSGTVVKKTKVGKAGNMPAASGTLSIHSTFHRSVSGAMGSVSGTLSKKTKIKRYGNMPSAAGALAKKIKVLRYGNMPASSGSLGTKIVVKQSTAGNMPASSGALSAATTFRKAIAGTMGAITGTIKKKIYKGLSGVFGTIAGAVTKKTSKTVQGDMPSATGECQPAFTFKQTVSGIMGTISGVVSTIKNPIYIARETFKILGSNLKKFLQ